MHERAQLGKGRLGQLADSVGHHAADTRLTLRVDPQARIVGLPGLHHRAQQSLAPIHLGEGLRPRGDEVLPASRREIDAKRLLHVRPAGLEQGVLGGEVSIHRPLGHLRLLRDLRIGELIEPVVLQATLQCVKDRRTRRVLQAGVKAEVGPIHGSYAAMWQFDCQVGFESALDGVLQRRGMRWRRAHRRPRLG